MKSKTTDDEPIVLPKNATIDPATGKMAPRRGATPADLGLIPIDGSPSAMVKPSGKTDPYAFYMNYYRSQDPDRTDPEKLRTMVLRLNQLRKTREVHAALVGYLKNHRGMAEPWMYEALAKAIEINRGSAADVKTALNFAADLAERSHNPNHLVSAADQLFMKGYFERVGPMLDQAMVQVPHRAEPLVMSIKLAQKTKDPNRMSNAVERLLSLGWPGRDEVFRIEAANEVDLLDKALREDNRVKEADALRAKLTESEARDLFLRLTWDGDADFDLVVDEPLGATASFQTPRTVFGGSLVKNGYGSHPEEVYVCPRAFDGDYTVRVTTIWTNPAKPVTRLTLESITHEGTANQKKQSQDLSPDQPNKPIVVHVSGGRRKTVLPYIDPVAAILSSPLAGSSKHARAPGKTKSGAPKPASSQGHQSPPSDVDARSKSQGPAPR
ncbi:MAG: hypothetical protein ACHRXM_09045 [Isosphaerales bacterium]